MISGYIHILISVAGMSGAYIIAKLKNTDNVAFIIACKILIASSLILVVVAPNFQLSIEFFLIHVFIMTAEEVVSFSLINSLISRQTRTTLLSVYYTFEAIMTIGVLSINSLISSRIGMGETWCV